jgi:hypothetical protein
MVTLGAFGPEIFDDPRKIGRPNEKPKVTSPEVLSLMREFPHMHIDGQKAEIIVGDETRILPSTLVKVPGKEPVVIPGTPMPDALYRIQLDLVSTETGLATGLGRALGVAQAKRQVPATVWGLAGQLLSSLEDAGPVRIGVAGIRPLDDAARDEKADALVAEAAAQALERLSGTRAAIIDAETTRLILEAAGVTVEKALSESRAVKGIDDLDYVLVGTVSVRRI